MGVLTRLGYALADRIDRRDGLTFTISIAASPQRAAIDAGVSDAFSAPETAGTLTDRPGAGHHANDCAYLDDPVHRCVNESGQPSNVTCIATWARSRLPKEVA